MDNIDACIVEIVEWYESKDWYLNSKVLKNNPTIQWFMTTNELNRFLRNKEIATTEIHCFINYFGLGVDPFFLHLLKAKYDTNQIIVFLLEILVPIMDKHKVTSISFGGEIDVMKYNNGWYQFFDGDVLSVLPLYTYETNS